jgi:pseudo-rSAM protein
MKNPLMKKSKPILYLEQYVHFERRKNNFFIYNAFNHFFWKQNNITDDVLLEVIDKLDNKTEETRVAELHPKDLNNKQIQIFIKKIKQSFSGGLLYNQNLVLPFVPKQNIYIYNDVEYMKVDSEYLLNYHIKLSISEITINTSICKIGTSINPQLFKESNTRQKQFSIYQFLPSILKQIEEFGNLRKINIICYSDSLLNDLKSFIDKLKFVSVCIHVELSYAQKVMDFFGNDYNYFIYFNPVENEIRTFINLCSESNYNCIPYFLIQDQKGINQIDFIQKSYQLPFRLYPVFTGTNQSFFVKYFSKTLSDILSLKPKIKDILTNGVLNRNFFGRVYIDEYANISTLGEMSDLNLKRDSLIDHAYREHKLKGKWFIVRQNLEPCFNCIYHNLCPPISNYELLMNKYNFCNFSK